MRIGTETGRLAVSGAAMALLFAIAILYLAGTAFATANQTVLCQGTITNSSDPSVPIGPTFSVGNVAVNLNSTTKNCAVTVATVTQVTQGTCNGQTPCVVTLTETNCVPLDTTGCVAANGCSVNKIPGITISVITASSDPDLVGCQETSIANTYSGTTGSFTMTITPVGPGATTCKATLTGITACTSNLQ